MNCTYCDGFHFVRPNDGWGEIRVCPVCGCDRCERLRWASPDDGGCICPKKKGKQAKKRAGIVSSNRGPKEAHNTLSVPPIQPASKAVPLIVGRYEPFTYSNQQTTLLTIKDRDAIYLATARALDGIVQCKLSNPAVSLNEVLASFDQAIRSLFPGSSPLPIRSAPVPPPYQPDKQKIERQIPLYMWQQGKLLSDLLLNLGVPLEGAINGDTYEHSGYWYQLHQCGVYVQRRLNARVLIPGGVISSRGELEALRIVLEQRVQQRAELFTKRVQFAPA